MAKQGDGGQGSHFLMLTRCVDALDSVAQKLGTRTFAPGVSPEEIAKQICDAIDALQSEGSFSSSGSDKDKEGAGKQIANYFCLKRAGQTRHFLVGNRAVKSPEEIYDDMKKILDSEA